MRIIWSIKAKRDRSHIIRDIALDNPDAAERMNALFRTSALRLGSMPFMGKPGALAGMREFIPHPSYRLVYEVTDDEIIVHALVHTARQWPPADEDDA